MLERIALDAIALRAQLPELTLRVGSTVVARVAEREAEHGLIVLAGVPLVAKLPPEVEVGQTLHLVVSDVSRDQVTLRLDHQAMAAHAPPPPPPPQPRLTVADAPRRTPGDEQGATVALAFESAVLGRLDLRIDIARASVSARVTAPPGAAVERAEAAAERLRAALAEQTGRPAQVHVAARRDPFDAYA